MTGNTNYTGNVAFSTELVLSTQFENNWLRAAPLLAKIREGETNWNKGSEFTGGAKTGFRMLLPIELADMATPADGVTVTNEFTAITPFGTDGFTHAQYIIAQYRAGLFNKRSELVKINNDRGNFLASKQKQLMNSFTNVLAADLVGTQADDEDTVEGIQHALSTSNTVGNISQSTDTDWASNVSTSVGDFSLDVLDSGGDAVKPRNGKIDLVLLAYSSTNNLFGALRSAIAPAQRIVNDKFEAKYGFENIVYNGGMCISENRLTAGVICGLTTSKWFYRGHERPVLSHNGPIQGTTAEEHIWYMFACVATNNPAASYRKTGVNA